LIEVGDDTAEDGALMFEKRGREYHLKIEQKPLGSARRRKKRKGKLGP